MRPWLIGAVLLGSAVAAIWTEVILSCLVHPPDATPADPRGLWVAMPYRGSQVGSNRVGQVSGGARK
jgi:hypothetical protein